MKNENKNKMLSAKEKRRLERFKKNSDEMQRQNYKRSDMTINLTIANIVSLLMFMLIYILGSVLTFLVHGELQFAGLAGKGVLFVVLFIILIVVHELIHGACWSIFAPGHFSDIEFGIQKLTFTPYCTCLVPLEKRQYIIGAIMPGLVLGVIPFIIAIIIQDPFLLLIGDSMIAGATGDLMVLLKMVGYKSSANEVMFVDHPTEAGFVIFER